MTDPAHQEVRPRLVVRCRSVADSATTTANRSCSGACAARAAASSVVTSLRFGTVPEPVTTRVEARRPDTAVRELVSAWRTWAPAEPGAPVQATLCGAATRGEGRTRDLLCEFADGVGPRPALASRAGLPYHRLKTPLAEPPGRPRRIRSEFFAHAMSGRGRRDGGITFTAMGGAVNRVADFPDLAPDDWATAYHDRPSAVRHADDPHRFFHFHEAI